MEIGHHEKRGSEKNGVLIPIFTDLVDEIGHFCGQS
jgi:hypothetical protein